ncbi:MULTISPECIES: 4'-phosphopantetheinyl transferase family protein [unclassified Streptomyces]|uniref:4'-phosphopantetheinyl transferase family protein n=1 Tax=unclassified Streptomyces TaxID=2593676 RepID=UPI002E2899FA|nr:4'-phosphopantetheinyl transferase superfamily protein [Streptomyces sp. NBC_00223]
MRHPLFPTPTVPPPASATAGGLLIPTALGTVYAAAVPTSALTAAPQVWLVDTTAHRHAASRRAPVTLDPEELARAAEFLYEGDRDAYVCAHVALRRLIGAYLGLPPRDVSLSRAPCAHCGGPHGRPVVPGDALHFSLSHCADLSLLAFATAPVGVDVESIPAPRTVAETTDVLHPREAAELALLAPAERPLAFTRVWTRKEAYLKGRGVGLSADPAADYVGSGPVAVALPDWSVTDVAVPDGHCAAVAVHVPGLLP